MILDDINAMEQRDFTRALGDIFEHSPWVAERAWQARPFANLDSLCAAMAAVVEAADGDAKLTLLRAHPDLAGKAARRGGLSEASTREQAGAGLDRLSDAEYARFHILNDAYQRRFAFPFIVAVRDHTKASILEAFETRLDNGHDDEVAEALGNVARIAKYRLEELIDG